jgi:hypothetical protein
VANRVIMQFCTAPCRRSRVAPSPSLVIMQFCTVPA